MYSLPTTLRLPCTKLQKGQGLGWCVQDVYFCGLLLVRAAGLQVRPASSTIIRNSILALPQDAFARGCETPSVVSFYFPSSYNSRRFLSFDLYLLGLGLFLSFGLNFSLSPAIWVCGYWLYSLERHRHTNKNHHLLV